MIAITVIVLIWLTSAVSTAIYVVDVQGSASRPAWVNSGLTTTHVGSRLMRVDSPRTR